MATRRASASNTRSTSLAPVLPVDVRAMNGIALGIGALAALVLLAAALAWLSRLPVFALRSIQVDGEVSRSSVATIRANAAPRLAGNFFSFDLNRGRAAFESVPWVRNAVVRRVWPNRLAVTLSEHHAVALWAGVDGNDRLVNMQGEVFDANLGDVEDEALPRFVGPDVAAAARMLAFHERLVPLLARHELGIDALELSRRGSWRVELDNGAMVELGRGSPNGDFAEVLARTDRFVRTLPQLQARFGQRALEHADLRHPDGYALKLKGITTLALPAGTAPRN